MFTPLRTNYLQDVALWPDSPLYRIIFFLIALLAIANPFFLDTFFLGELTLFVIYSGIGCSLVFLTGYGGLVSLGQAAFLAIGAYAHSFFLTNGIPFYLSLLLTIGVSTLCGFTLSYPIRHLKGVYLSIATLALSVLVQELCMRWHSVTGGLRGLIVPNIIEDHRWEVTYFYFICIIALALLLFCLNNLLRTPRGRALIAIRDAELSGQALGINVGRTRVFAFAITSAATGLFGALLAHKMQFLTPEAFSPMFSIQLLLMVIIGGMYSFYGGFLGAAIVLQIPQIISWLKDTLPRQVTDTPGLEPGLFGLILIFFILVEPLGIYGRWTKIRVFFESFPLYRKGTFDRQHNYASTERIH
mgnify:CR=1 FL=1